MTGNMKMTVNVSLCGSIPRSQMSFCSKKRLRELRIDSSDPQNSSYTKPQGLSSPIEGKKLRLSLPRQVSCETINVPFSPPIIEPPSWAVAAKGDAKLQPIGESCHLQSSVDLTTRVVFNIGRSQNSDVQLLHCTSSRRHAILFHHPNGNCYVVDCGSAHGTYVNGERVKSAVSNEINDSNPFGTILPYRVKKGALIRFGGPGAPTFILKSFSSGIKALMDSLVEMKQSTVYMNVSNPNQHVQYVVDNKINRRCFSSDELVILNTRLNAAGVSADLLVMSKQVPEANLSKFPFLKKRSIISFDEESDGENEVNTHKKLKVASIATNNDNEDNDPTNFYEPQDIAIVSPIRQKPGTVFYCDESDRPVVSPTPLLDENQATSKSLEHVLHNDIKNVRSASLTLSLSKKKSCRVSFCDKPPKVFYPPSVTPDSSSDRDS